MAYYSSSNRRSKKTYSSAGRKKFGGVKKRRGTRFGYSKKSGYSTAAIRAVVKAEVKKSAGTKDGKSHRIVVKGFPGTYEIGSSVMDMQNCYLRLPITALIPPQRGPGSAASELWRSSNKVLIKGVRLRFALAQTASMQALAVLYPARAQLEPVPIKKSADGIPQIFQAGVPVEVKHENQSPAYRLLQLDEVNCKNVHGPFGVRTEFDKVVPDSMDGSLFDCQLSRSKGAPIGTVSWKSSHDGKTKRGMKYDETFQIQGLMRTGDINTHSGIQHLQTHRIDLYWEVNKEIEFTSSEGSETLVYEPDHEILLGIRCLDAYSGGMPANPVHAIAAGPVGVISGLTIDVYYQ